MAERANRVRARGRWLAALLVPIAVAAAARAAGAREVSVPVRIDHTFLRQILVTQVFRQAGESVRTWDDGSGCNFLELAAPKVDEQEGKLRVTARVEARVGKAIGSKCLTPIDTKGVVELLEDPVLDPALPVVRFHVVDSNLYDGDGKKSLARGTLWDWVKKYVHPRLEDVTIDLQSPLAELRGFLPLVLPAASADRAQSLLDSVALRNVRVIPTGIEMDLDFATPAPGLAALPEETPAPEPTLGSEELKRWEATLQRWDAFLTFIVKQAGGDTQATELRHALLDVLLEGRYDLLEALRPATPGAPDPVPGLFLKTWARLGPVLRQLSLGLPGEGALRYLSFITAADALQALDQIGPEVGLDISADGLRRLARIVAPAQAEDPLAYRPGVDPELRRLFGFGEPLPPPEENPDVDGGDDADPQAGKGTPLASRFSLRLAALAWAADEPGLPAIVARLNRWAPTPDEIERYLPLVRDLLDRTSAKTQEAGRLKPELRELYRPLVLATAWQETCWRQFVKHGDRLKPIRSPAGAVGLMQVNQLVWRGFYDQGGLASDIGYNARAGSEILARYLVDYVVAAGAPAAHDPDALARRTYAVYNGGPAALTRHGRPQASRGARRRDRAFSDKYRRVKSGDDLAVIECYRG